MGLHAKVGVSLPLTRWRQVVTNIIYNYHSLLSEDAIFEAVQYQSNFNIVTAHAGQ